MPFYTGICLCQAHEGTTSPDCPCPALPGLPTLAEAQDPMSDLQGLQLLPHQHHSCSPQPCPALSCPAQPPPCPARPTNGPGSWPSLGLSPSPVRCQGPGLELPSSCPAPGGTWAARPCPAPPDWGRPQCSCALCLSLDNVLHQLSLCVFLYLQYQTCLGPHQAGQPPPVSLRHGPLIELLDSPPFN